MTASLPVRKLWPVLAVLSVAAVSACAPKPTEEPSASSAAEDPAAMHTPADDVAGRDSAAALEAAMAASPSAVDVMVQSAAASSAAAQAGAAPAAAASPEHAPEHTPEHAPEHGKPAH